MQCSLAERRLKINETVAILYYMLIIHLSSGGRVFSAYFNIIASKAVYF
jgi:hypothetical protein